MAKGRIAVVGDKESILAFKAIGMEIFPTENKEDTRKIIRKLATEEYSVVFITETACAGAEEYIDRYLAQPFPAIIPIPSAKGTTGFGMAKLKANIEKAVGADILLN